MATTTRAAGRGRESGRSDLVRLGVIVLLAGFLFAVRADAVWAVAIWGTLMDAYIAVANSVGQFFADMIVDGIQERQVPTG